MATRKKKLTIGAIEKLDKDTFKTEKIEILGYEVTISKKFRDSVIQTLIEDVVETHNYLSGIGENSTTVSLIPMFTIKHFTDIPFPTEIEEQFAFYKKMLDLKIVEPIMNAYDTIELQKIPESFKNAQKGAKLILDQLAMTSFVNGNE